MRYRKLRIAWSVVWGLACVLLIVLWVRSYWWCDIVSHRPSITIAFRLLSDEGQVSFFDCSESLPWLGEPPPIGWSTEKKWYAGYGSDVSDNSPLKKVFRGFARNGTYGKQVPDWFLVVVVAGLGAAPWLSRWPWRFSLRTLLIATTLIAVVLGLIVWLQ
jgi:hypothetical protein